MPQSPWNDPSTVAGFAQSAPNATLMQWVEELASPKRQAIRRTLDIGCGAGRNAIPIARLGCTVVGVDLSWPMLLTAMENAAGGNERRFHGVLAPMDKLPVRDGSADLVIAHGIWNLARSASEFRSAIGEAARAAAHGAALFVFTFSRNTLPDDARPVEGESFIFTEFSGNPQCFLTKDQLIEELGAAGFVPDPKVPLTELNRAGAGMLRMPAIPVIWQGGFRFASR